MRPIFPPNLANINGAKVWKKRNKFMIERHITPNRKLEDIKKASLFSIGKLPKAAKTKVAQKVLDNLISQFNLQKKPFPYHFVILPTGRIFQCCRLDVYYENNHFDNNSIGIALLTSDNSVIPRMTRGSLSNMFQLWQNDLIWEISPIKWKHSALLYEQDSTTEFFEKIWNQCVDEKKNYIEMKELKNLLKLLMFRRTITVKNED